MEFVHDIMQNTQFPVFTALLLGLVVAMHPCPLAANIAAFGYLSRDLHDRRRAFLSGLAYVFGRMLAYGVLGTVLVIAFRGSMDMQSIGQKFGEWGETLLAPVMIIVGFYFIGSCFWHRHPHCHNIPTRKKLFHGVFGSLLLGIILALSFCPESAFVYFGMLLPMASASGEGLILIAVFSVSTSVPAIILAWGTAYGVSQSSHLHDKIHLFQRWVNAVVGVIFIAVGAFFIFH